MIQTLLERPPIHRTEASVNVSTRRLQPKLTPGANGMNECTPPSRNIGGGAIVP